MRLMLAVALATCGLAIGPSGGWPAIAVPGACPPLCNGIPDSAWVAPTAIPLYPVYRWPGLAGLSVTADALLTAYHLRRKRQAVNSDGVQDRQGDDRADA